MSRSDLQYHPGFQALQGALAPYASDPDDSGRLAGHRGQAAVSVILRGTGDLELLLIKRAKSRHDPWSGHMALPGGRRGAGDPSLLHTALRETEEETGIRLEERGCHLGRLEVVAPRYVRLPPLAISPFVFGVPARTTARPDEREVTSVHWTPLASLQAVDAVQSVSIRIGGEKRKFPCFRVDDEPVWGLTYRILGQLLEVIAGLAAFSEIPPDAQSGWMPTSPSA